MSAGGGGERGEELEGSSERGKEPGATVRGVKSWWAWLKRHDMVSERGGRSVVMGEWEEEQSE